MKLLPGGSTETAVRALVPSWSCGITRTLVVNAPFRSVVTVPVVEPRIPWLHAIWTCVLAGKSLPWATATVPGGPTDGVSVSTGFSTGAGLPVSGPGVMDGVPGGGFGQGTTDCACAIGMNRSNWLM